MAESGESFSMREYADRAKRLFSSPDHRDLLSDNAPKKRGLIITFCVLASCLLWFSFSMRETYTQFFDFPTEILNLPPDQALTEMPPSTVRVQVEGEGIQLLRLYYTPPTVSIDASVDEVDLQILTAEVTGNVRQESVVPSTVFLRKEARTERRIPVRSALDIEMESGYEIVGPIQFTPDSVTISGAVSVVRRLNFWPTERRRLEMVRDTVRIRVELSDTLSALVRVSAFEAIMQADVVRFTSGSREIPIRIKDGPGQDTFTFEPLTTIVTYNVPILQFDQALEADDFYAFVPYDEILNDTTGRVYPMVNIPENLLLREINIFPNAFRYYRNLPSLD